MQVTSLTDGLQDLKEAGDKDKRKDETFEG